MDVPLLYKSTVDDTQPRRSDMHVYQRRKRRGEVTQSHSRLNLANVGDNDSLVSWWNLLHCLFDSRYISLIRSSFIVGFICLLTKDISV